MKCRVCSSEIYAGDTRCRRCGTTVPTTQTGKKGDIRIRESLYENMAGSTSLLDKKSDEVLPGGVGELLDRSGKDNEVYDAYFSHIKKRLSEFPPDDEHAQKCRVVFERMTAHKKDGDTSKALRYGATCIVMLEEISPTRLKQQSLTKISPELKKIAQMIDLLQSKALEIGVNVLKSDRLRATAVDAFRIKAIEQGANLLQHSLEMLNEEIRIHILQLLVFYQGESEKAKSIKIDASRLDALIRETRLLIAKKDYMAVVEIVPWLRKETVAIKKEYNRKTNTFDCPVCGMSNSIENRECVVCGTLFPELGPVYKGEKIKVIPPIRKLK